ncbi:MAG: DUF2953 domain-containing protein [Oscillospiraceae bacterium]|nr:DUF2953 domain-containing protein [Oscillospiraceae bacterium]
MGWIITFSILFLLAILPLGVDVRYNAEGPRVKIVAGPVKLTVFPQKKKAPKKEKPVSPEAAAKAEQEAALPKPPKPPKKAAKASSKEPKPEKGGSLMDFLPLVKLAFGFLGDFRRKLRLQALELKLILAGGDPCDLAVNYGRAWAAVGNLIPRLENWFVIKNRDIQVNCDFCGSETLVIAHLQITVTLGRLLSLVAVYGVRALKEYLSIQKKRKGGAVT